MTSPIPISNHFENDRRRSSCCSYCHDDSSYCLENPFSAPSQTFGFTPPLENIYTKEDELKPFSCIYLLNLFLAPDMKRYLQETSYSDDVYDMPIHLQRLICEARMEVMISKQDNGSNYSNKPKQEKAYNRLLKLKHYVDSVSHHDVASVIAILNELVHDDDELTTILGE